MPKAPATGAKGPSPYPSSSRPAPLFWIVNGCAEIFAALSHRKIPARGWTVFTGALSIVAGLIALIFPGISPRGTRRLSPGTTKM